MKASLKCYSACPSYKAERRNLTIVQVNAHILLLQLQNGDGQSGAHGVPALNLVEEENLREKEPASTIVFQLSVN